MELNKLRNGARSGPFESFRWGKYNGRRVKEIIKEDPMYIMVAVKDWLYLSPEQSDYFTLLYDGEIPSEFIRDFPSRVKNPFSEESKESFPSLEAYLTYMTNRDIKPNLDFYKK